MGCSRTSKTPGAASYLRAISLVSAVAFVVAACASSQPGPSGTSYVVSSKSASFFKYGPAQEFGADFTMTPGQHLTMIHREFGYSRVMTDNGISGYVSNDDLKPGPPPTPVPKATPAASSGFWGKRKWSPASNFKPSSQPLFDVNDVPPPPLPAGGEKAHGAPGFRY